MLIRCEVENFKSIREPAELTLVAIDERPETRMRTQMGLSLLPVAGIFGPNASGKSTVLSALVWLRDAVNQSLTHWDHEIPVHAFAYGDGVPRDTSFALELDVDGLRYKYVLHLNREGVTYEALFHYPQGKRRRLFERDHSALNLHRGLSAMIGARALLTRRSLALTLLHRFDEPLINNFVSHVTGIVALHAPYSAGYEMPSSTEMFDAAPGPLSAQCRLSHRVPSDPQSRRARGLALLRCAGLGIVEVEVGPDDARLPGHSNTGSRVARLVHTIGSQTFAVEPAHESAGTLRWFNLIGPLMHALDSGGIAVFDDLDACLHPTLAAHLVRLFSNPASNPRDAQLVFSAHNTNLLNHLNRDEVWLTQKDPSGGTTLTALADFGGPQVQTSTGLERGYLSGRFGALPDINQWQ